MTLFIAWISNLLSFLILEGIWLGLIAMESYKSSMKGLLREEFPVAPWVLFYIIYSFAIAYLVISPSLNHSWVKVLFSGCLLGLAAYGAYNLTNYAILKNWPLDITIKDLIWGTCVTGATSLIGWSITRHIVAYFKL